MLDEIWRQSMLRPPLSWLQVAACDAAVGFRPQLHAAAAIAAQTEPPVTEATYRRLAPKPLSSAHTNLGNYI